MEEKCGAELELKNSSFSIICNNCLGGFICQHYNIEYRTPTLGLFIFAQDYVKFLAHIKFYLSQKLEFIKPEQSMYYDEFKKAQLTIKFPMARLHDIEVFFMHYKDEEEAASKWYRRINKINWNDLIVILAENETCTYETLKKFDSLPFKNKVCFTKEEHKEIGSSCCIEEMREPGSLWSAETVMKHFDLTSFINNRVQS